MYSTVLYILTVVRKSNSRATPHSETGAIVAGGYSTHLPPRTRQFGTGREINKGTERPGVTSSPD